MAHSTLLLLSIILAFRSVLSYPILPGLGHESAPSVLYDKQTARDLSLSPSSSLTAGQDTTGWTWFYVSGDGSQILPIKGPQDKPTGLAASSNGHSYTYGFSNNHGPVTPRPGLAKFLFDCEFGLFDATPASGLGVWTPYPRGQYVCNGDDLPDGQLSMRLVANTIQYKMAIHDLAFFNKVLHDTRGVEDGVPFFDFVFNYTPELNKTPYERVVQGKWRSKFDDDGGTAAN